MGWLTRDHRSKKGRREADDAPKVTTFFYAVDGTGRKIWAGRDASDYPGEVHIVHCRAATWYEAKADRDTRLEQILAEIEQDTESRAAQDEVTTTTPPDEDNETPATRNDEDIASYAAHDAEASPERSPYVSPAQECVMGGTATSARPHHIYNPVNRGGRPVKGLKSPVPPAFLLYYRPGDGFKEDLDLILAKTGIGPAGLARALGVSRRRIHAWRADGMPQSMDPLVFWQVLWWAYLLRGKRYGWQR